MKFSYMLPGCILYTMSKHKVKQCFSRILPTLSLVTLPLSLHLMDGPLRVASPSSSGFFNLSPYLALIKLKGLPLQCLRFPDLLKFPNYCSVNHDCVPTGQ